MDVHLVDGTYELFRHFFAVPSHVTRRAEEVGATRGVLSSILYLLEGGATHVGVATDQVIESFRNQMWPGYKTGEGVDPTLMAQFPVVEEALAAMGVVVWPMVELEADDALASAARLAAAASEVGRVFICTPDKDLAQSVRGERVVQLDRRARKITDEAGVVAKFGVGPASIPDYLALVGDSSDGFPGLRGWGPASAGAVLARYAKLEAIPRDGGAWEVTVRGADRLRSTLREQWEQALLFRDLATLRDDAPLFTSVSEIEWQAPRSEFDAMCDRLEAPELMNRARAIEQRRSARGAW